MYKYITILGAARQIAQRLTATLLTYTDMHITLYGRQLSSRIHPEILEHNRITVIEGSFQNPKKLEETVKNSEVVFLSAMETSSDMAAIVKALSAKMYAVSSAYLSQALPVNSQKNWKNGPSTDYQSATYRANAKHAMYCVNPT